MKIERPSQTGPASKSKKSGNSSTAGGASFGSVLAGVSSDAASVSTTQSLTQMDALLAAQGAENPTERAAKKRMTLRADDLLDKLDTLRTSLLTGTLTVGHVINIADIVASHREQISDPALTALLDEIDLRAQIEIAKMRKSLD